MRIVGKNKRNYFLLGLILLVILTVIGLVYFPSPKAQRTGNSSQYYLCDAEKVQDKNFVGQNGKFRNAHCQSMEKYFSGKASCKCTRKSKYGFTRNLDGLFPGDTVIYSVWMFEDEAEAKLVFSSDGNDLYKSSENIVDERDGWKKISETIVIPLYYTETRTVIYPVVTRGNGSVYFDDLEIMIISPGVEDKIPEYAGAHLEMQLTNDNYNKIMRKRDEAWEIGLLFSSKEDLVDADIKMEKKNYGARVRLKGDLMDHLSNGKYSFRVELKGKKEWRGMGTFSMHNSLARSHLAEWYMHEIFKKEEIITPAYDFINFSLNGKNLGIYAYEQHFDNGLLDLNKRPVGPIIRHTDDGYWENVNKKIEPFYWTNSSQIELFNKENAGDPEFVKLYDTAHSMLNDFIKGRKKVSEVFDLDKMAKYFALLETSHAIHAQLFTNIRFYLNPYVGLLEPIGYDCFGNHLPNVNKNWTAMGEGFNRNWESNKFIEAGNDYMALLFEDNAFFALYIHYLLKFTSKDYLAQTKKEFEKQALARAIYIRSDQEYKNYTESWDQVFLKSEFSQKKIYPKPNYSLIGYIRDNDRSKIQLHGFHYFPLEVLGYVHKGVRTNLDSILLLEAYNAGVEHNFINVDLKSSASQILYRTLGTDSVFVADIPRTNAPMDDVPVVEASKKNIEQLEFLIVEGKKIIFKKGIWDINKPVVLPKGYIVTITQGTTLNFKNDACIITYSPIRAIGNKKDPINFVGEGDKNNAIYILESDEISIFKNCNFHRLGQFVYRNINTDGALSVYKSKIELEDCMFNDIIAKDALNLAMSQCTLYNVEFKSCKGDLLDSYYSNIYIDQLSAERIGKDGIELTGGVLNAKNIKLESILRTGVRAMDMAKVNIRAIEMKDVNLALFASQHSTMYINGITLYNIERGVEMVSEEEPHCRIELLKYNGKKVEQEYMIQKNAKLTINGYKKKPF